MSVDPIGNRSLFRPTTEETVTAPTPIEASGASLAWGPWTLDASWTLRNASDAWTLEETVYVLAEKAVDFVVLVFRREATHGVSRVAVRVSPETFREKLAAAASVCGVVSTIPSSKSNVKPDAQGFPQLALGFTVVARGARANTAVAPTTLHVAVDASRSTFYMPLVVYAAVEYLGAKVDVDSAPRRLVVGPTRATDGLKDHRAGASPGEEELVEDGACFVNRRLSFCYATGKLTAGTGAWGLSEVLYVPDPDQGWACVLCFRAHNNAGAPLALRLGFDDARMLMMRMNLNVLTSTAIHDAPVQSIPWPNAHSQDTTDARVARTIAAEHSGLMLDEIARMVYVPGAPIIRYEPTAECRWGPCAADAAARASGACAAFTKCKGAAVVSRLVDAREGAPVDLYAAPPLANAALVGVTPRAVYVVKPTAPASAKVVVARAESSELAEATLAAGIWTVRAAEPPCASLRRCMKSAGLKELEYCKAHAEACAYTHDRSAVAASLVYEGTAVELRALDESTMYGIDPRGAFALRTDTGGVLFVPGAQKPQWPPTGKQHGTGSVAVALSAGYDADARAWRVGYAATTAKPEPSLVPLWIVLGIFGAFVLAVAAVYLTRARRAR
jgi:hypothetical protein